MSVLWDLANVVSISGTVRERARFVLRQARRQQRLASYRLAGSDVVFHLRHATPDVATLDQVIRGRHYVPPGPVASSLTALSRPLRVVDLGANIGLFGADALRRWPDAKVVAFEPDPFNAEVVRHAIAANPSLDWELVEACAGVEDGQVTFAAGMFANSRIADDDVGGQPVAVRDAYAWLGDADYIKVDIEGAEWALAGDPRFRDLTATAIAFEYHPHGCPSSDPHEVAVRTLEQAGFEVLPGELEAGSGHGMVWGWKTP